MRKSKYTKELLQDLVAQTESVAGILKKLGLAPSGGTHRYIRSLLNLHSIDTSHFTGQLWSKGKTLGENYYGTSRSLDEILVENSSYASARLKRRLIKAGLKEGICEECGIKEWMGKPIVLELHHVNENPNDNRIENLMILCPNCHSIAR